MRSTKVIHVVSCHAEGEVGDVILGGVQPPPGDTIWEQSRFIAGDEALPNFMLNEPRGGVFRHVNLLVPGMVPMQEPQTELVLEAPGGIVEITAMCREGKAERISVRNVPSFADRLDAVIEVAGIGTLTVDTGYGGDSFVIADARSLGFAISPDEARDIAETGVKITEAANEQLGFAH